MNVPISKQPKGDPPMDSNPKPTPQKATTGGSTVEPQATTEKEVRTMFHGMIRKGNSDMFRVATNVPLKGTDIVVEEFDSGVYSFTLLDTFFPEGYRLEVRSVMDDKVGVEGPLNVYDPTNDKFVTIRWSNATHQYNLMLKRNNGWLDALTDAGFVIGNSKKFTKRAQELVRMTSAFIHCDELKIHIMDPKKLGNDEKVYDGISAISHSTAMQMFLNNPTASDDWKNNKVEEIERGRMTVVQIRVITPHGLIKGNAFVVPDNQMGGYDIRTFTPNVKPEFKSNGFYFATIEPSYGRLPLKSDDLTMSIYRNVTGLVDSELLLGTLESALNELVAQIKQEGNQDPDWIQTLVDNTGLIEHDSDVNKHGPNLIKSISQLSMRLREAGLGISVSQLLMHLRANGLGMMFGVLDRKGIPVRHGEAFNATNNGNWFPVPYAYRAHIMTRGALSIFGYKLPKDNGKAFYHEKTHCFVVPNQFFIDNYVNHGGFDLDDTINVMIRQFVGENGEVTLKAFLVRNPNDFGEWSCIPVSDKEIKYAFHKYGEIPTVNEVGLRTVVPQLSDLINNRKIKYEYNELPGVSALCVSDQFGPEDEERVRNSMQELPGGTGATVLPKMLTYAITGTYLKRQLVSNEKIIDAVQQGLADSADMALIHRANANYYNRIKRWLIDNDAKIDYYWYKTRITLPINKEYGFSGHEQTVAESPMMQLMLKRETIVRKVFAELRVWANNDISEPVAIANIIWTPQEIKTAPGEFNVIQNMKLDTDNKNWASKLVAMLQKSDELYGEEITDRKVLRMYHQGIIAKRHKPLRNWDAWLFTVDPSLEQLPIDWFIRAYTRLVINQ